VKTLIGVAATVASLPIDVWLAMLLSIGIDAAADKLVKGLISE
jgi:hypothetical protein